MPVDHASLSYRMAELKGAEAAALPDSEEAAGPTQDEAPATVAATLVSVPLVQEPESGAEEAVHCGKCGVELSTENMAASRGDRHRPLCRSCHNLVTMLRRNLGGMPPEWDDLSAEHQMDFFKKCCAKRAEGGGPLSFHQVKGLMVDTMVQGSTTTDSTVVGGGFYPLSYWAAQGFDTAVIEANAPSEDHAFLGKTYCVPIKTMSHEEKVHKVQESLIKLERNVRKRKNPETAIPNAKAKAKSGPMELPDEQKQIVEQLKDVVNLETDSEDENWKAPCLWKLNNKVALLRPCASPLARARRRRSSRRRSWRSRSRSSRSATTRL